MIQVLLADDQALVRAGFRALLDEQDDMKVIGEAVIWTSTFSRRFGRVQAISWSKIPSRLT
jgi:DNA-binding NarL/FixJ family response regulator